MINREMARDYLARAERCLKEASLALEENDCPGAVRRSQEALELAVKGLLRLLAVEYPKTHDVGDALMENVSRIPVELRGNVEGMAKLMAELASLRGPAFYGYEREGIPASKAFKKNYAEDVYRKVETYVKAISSSLKRYI
ncbi:MAG: HEPN domain-containing protein [Candidatus Bathyarchaeia archaeon]